MSSKKAAPTYLRVKVYAVLQPVSKADDGEPNLKLLDIKLTNEAATALVEINPEAFIVRILADKRHTLTTRRTLQPVAAKTT